MIVSAKTDSVTISSQQFARQQALAAKTEWQGQWQPQEIYRISAEAAASAVEAARRNLAAEQGDPVVASTETNREVELRRRLEEQGRLNRENALRKRILEEHHSMKKGDAERNRRLLEEAAKANAPRIVPFGLSMLAPVLMKFGSKEQQEH